MLTAAMWTLAAISTVGLIAGLRQQQSRWNVTAVFVLAFAWVVNAPSFIGAITGRFVIRYDPTVQADVRLLLDANTTVRNYLLAAITALAVGLILWALPRRPEIRSTGLLALALCLLTNISNAGIGLPVVTPGSICLVAVLVATMLLPRGRTMWLGPAVFGVTMVIASAVLAAVDPARATYLCRTDKCGPLGVLITGVTQSENALALALALSFPFVYLAFTGRVRLVLTTCVLTMIYLSGNRTALVAVVPALLLIPLLRPANETRYPAGETFGRLFIGALAVIGLALPFAPWIDQNSFTTRGYLWTVALERLSNEPWLGFGASGWARLVQEGAIGQAAIYSAHNQWIDVLYAGGIVGLALFALWLYFLVREGRTEVRVLTFVLAPALAAGITERPWSFGLPDWLTWSVLAVMLTAGRDESTAAADLEPRRRDLVKR
ncbi:O-antigen ligase family protein [Nocardioides sp.]|uniref:O-antigen ligase family protein n=1 Tax=Nocardioides sp. TaxID=35761 RepID=UPI001A18DBD2|nr:O-antigen ligase family protein [Nocardioides sp.]MBJ7357263.1 O-antigen ligase family protein [Nocardioides sp.]